MRGTVKGNKEPLFPLPLAQGRVSKRTHTCPDLYAGTGWIHLRARRRLCRWSKSELRLETHPNPCLRQRGRRGRDWTDLATSRALRRPGPRPPQGTRKVRTKHSPRGCWRKPR